MSNRLQVDIVACDGYGACAEVLPEMIRVDEWGYPILTSDIVPPVLTRHARRAVTLCPKRALSLAPAADRGTGGRPTKAASRGRA